jgi:hypothetical protein
MSAMDRPLTIATAPPAFRRRRASERRCSSASSTCAGESCRSTSVPSMSRK